MHIRICATVGARCAILDIISIQNCLKINIFSQLNTPLEMNDIKIRATSKRKIRIQLEYNFKK